MKKNQVGVRAWHVSYKNEARASGWINNRRVGEYIAPLLSVIRRASRGNQSRIRVGSFPGRMSSLLAYRTENRGRIEEADLRRCIEEESSRKASAWPDSRNDLCCEAKHLTDRHSWCDRHTPVRMQNVTGDPLAIPRPASPIPRKYVRPRRYANMVDRRSLKSRTIPGDPREALWNERGCATIPVSRNCSRRRTIPTIISACQDTIPFLSISDVLDPLRSKWSLTLTSSSYLLLNCQIFLTII